MGAQSSSFPEISSSHTTHLSPVESHRRHGAWVACLSYDLRVLLLYTRIHVCWVGGGFLLKVGGFPLKLYSVVSSVYPDVS